jgi:rare lipoprotein A
MCGAREFELSANKRTRELGGEKSRDPLPPRQTPSIRPNRALIWATLQSGFELQRVVNVSPSRIMIVTALVASLCACSVSKGPRSHVDETHTLSPRLIRVGDPVPKGGGVFKIGDPYLAGGRWYRPVNDTSYDQVGQASWYGDFFHGRKTANGEIYDMNALSAAHPTLPMPTYAAVTNLANNRTVVVRINDRGPYHADRIIDLSHRAAQLLGFYGHGTAPVRVRYFGPAPLNGDDSLERSILARQPWATHVVNRPPAPPTSPRATLFATAAMTAAPPRVVKAPPPVIKEPPVAVAAQPIAVAEPPLAVTVQPVAITEPPLVVKKGDFEKPSWPGARGWVTSAR